MQNGLVKPADIVWRKIGDEIVLITDDGLSVHVLNKTAALIWELSTDNYGVPEIAGKLSERFPVSMDEAADDVAKTISRMKEIGLVKQANEAVSE